MENWTLWLVALVASTTAAALVSFLWCRAQVRKIKTRVVLLEREISLARIREEKEEKKLREVFEALGSLQKTTDRLFGGLRKRVNEVLDHGGEEGYANR